MTLEELNSYNALKGHVEHCRDKIRELNAQTVRSPRFDTSGFPKSPSQNSVEQRYIDNIAAKELYERRIADDLALIARIEDYITAIDERRTRMIFEMHIYDSKKFWEIAMMFGGGNSEESVKSVFYRYLKHHPSG